MFTYKSLPSCILFRIKSRRGIGVMLMRWAAQVEILAQLSVGGSLFHSGWGPAIQTFQFGYRLIVLPFIIDQSFNARLFVGKSMSAEVEGSEDGPSSGEDEAMIKGYQVIK